MEFIQNKIDHWSEIEDKASEERSKENKDNSPNLLHSRSLICLVILVSPLNYWLVIGGKNIFQITVVISFDDVGIVNVVDGDK
jgi:hypothetical protein